MEPAPISLQMRMFSSSGNVGASIMTDVKPHWMAHHLGQ